MGTSSSHSFESLVKIDRCPNMETSFEQGLEEIGTSKYHRRGRCKPWPPKTALILWLTLIDSMGNADLQIQNRNQECCLIVLYNNSSPLWWSVCTWLSDFPSPFNRTTHIIPMIPTPSVPGCSFLLRTYWASFSNNIYWGLTCTSAAELRYKMECNKLSPSNIRFPLPPGAHASLPESLINPLLPTLPSKIEMC